MGGSHSSSADGLSSGKEIGGQNHQSHEGSASEPDIYPLAIKKEPEDLTRRNLRHVLHHPDSRIVCTSSSDNKVDGGVSGTVISRVLADGELVHEMIPRLESISHVMSGSSVNDSRDGANTSGSVIHIRRPVSSQQSQQHDGDNTMMSPAALDLARAGIQSALQQQYSPSAYTSNGGAVGSSGHQQSGLASIQTVNNHGYDSSPGPAYGLVSPNESGVYTAIHPSSTLRQQPTAYAVSSSVGSSDSFYRDYFNSSANTNSNANANGGSGDQQYARAVAQLAYGEGHETGFGDRFIRNQPGGIYKQQQQQQQQQGTGLTVDLPSPDSGIGVDAVTPRDQSVAQQVGLLQTETMPAFFRTLVGSSNYELMLAEF